MAITKETFKEIKNIYGDYSSFAIWNEKTKDLTMFNDDCNIIKTCDLINTHYIFLGINISKAINGKFSNFHSGNRDWVLKRGVMGFKKELQRTKFYGAYITDLYKDYSEKDSSKVFKYFKSNKKEEDNCFKILKNEIGLLGDINPVFIICSKNKEMLDAFNRFCDYCGRDFQRFQIHHYSSRKANPAQIINNDLIEISKFC